ncbi:MAG: hypothetical protein WCW33_01445 [Candidatus Babeliales bacterium]|jgi:hypothetical protein
MKKYMNLITIVTGILLMCSTSVNAAQVESPRDRLFVAIRDGNIKDVKKLLVQGADIFAEMPQDFVDEKGAIWLYLKSTRPGVVITPLHYAEALAATSLTPKKYAGIVKLLQEEQNEVEKKFAQMQEPPQKRRDGRGVPVGRLRPQTPPPSYEQAIRGDILPPYGDDTPPPSYEEAIKKDVKLPPYDAEAKVAKIAPQVPSAPLLPSEEKEEMSEESQTTILNLLKHQLIQAAASGDLETVKVISARLANLDISSYDKIPLRRMREAAFRVALVAAAAKGHEAIVAHLMGEDYYNFIALPNVFAGRGDMPTQIASLFAQYGSEMQRIFNRKLAKEDHPARTGETPLIAAFNRAVRACSDDLWDDLGPIITYIVEELFTKEDRAQIDIEKIELRKKELRAYLYATKKAAMDAVEEKKGEEEKKEAAPVAVPVAQEQVAARLAREEAERKKAEADAAFVANAEDRLRKLGEKPEEVPPVEKKPEKVAPARVLVPA